MEQWIVPIIVALIAPSFAYLAVIRKLSGRVETSEAGQLWHESAALRAEYLRRAEECEIQLKQLRHELQVCTARNTVLRRENRELRDALA